MKSTNDVMGKAEALLEKRPQLPDKQVQSPSGMQAPNYLPWNDDDDNQLVTYVKEAENAKEVADKMQRDVFDVLQRMHYLAQIRNEFQELKKKLR